MSSHWTVVQKLTTLFGLLGLAVACLLCALLVYQKDQSLTERQVNSALARQSLSERELQVGLYFRQPASLAQLSEELALSTGADFLALYDDQLRHLSAFNLPDESPVSRPEIISLRNGLADADIDQFKYRDPDSRQRFLALTLPVYGAANPNSTLLTEPDYIARLNDPSANRSLHLLGYLRMELNPGRMQPELYQFAVQCAVIAMLILLMCTLLFYIAVKRMTAPLARLAQMADNIYRGKTDIPYKISGAREISEIATLLNSIVSGIHHFKNEMNVNNSLLTMKVEERTRQLTQSNEQLKSAMNDAMQAKEHMHKLAYFDSLTGLPNRQQFVDRLNQLLNQAEKEDRKLAVIFIDLDNFKRINDSLGHTAGDAMLQEVAQRLLSCVRDSDLVSHLQQNNQDSRGFEVSRLGGDEFTIVLNQIDDQKMVEQVAQRILKTLSKPLHIEGHELVITPSIGIAVYPSDAEDVEGLLKHADTAMYHIKNNGKNGFQRYSSSMNTMGVERLKLEADLRRAVANNELVLHYQPQIDIQTGKLVGAEALVRWKHPIHGLVPPFKFITLAEEMGLIVKLGEWVLYEACRQTKAWHTAGYALPRIAVNLSSLQFDSPDFIDKTRSILEQTGLPARALKLELTESIIMKNVESAIDMLNQLKGLGITLSVDDFGTGYSSLNYLNRFPLDELKIDRSFVNGVDTNKDNAALITAIIAMANSLKFGLVAEGVETLGQLNFLKTQGIRKIQGYLFDGPVTSEEFEKRLAGQHNYQKILNDLNHVFQQDQSPAIVPKPPLSAIS